MRMGSLVGEKRTERCDEGRRKEGGIDDSQIYYGFLQGRRARSRRWGKDFVTVVGENEEEDEDEGRWLVVGGGGRRIISAYSQRIAFGGLAVVSVWAVRGLGGSFRRDGSPAERKAGVSLSGGLPPRVCIIAMHMHRVVSDPALQ